MSAIPLKSRIGTAALISTTFACFALMAQRSAWSWTGHDLTIALLLGALIVAAEIFDISFPNTAGGFFSVSVGAPIALAAGLALGPVRGGLVVILAILAESLYARRPLIKAVFNMANHGLSTLLSAVIYDAVADSTRTPLADIGNMSAVVLAALVFTLVNTTTLALVVAPVIGISPLQMYRTNLREIYVEMITLPTLGAVVPVLARESPFALLVLMVPLGAPVLALRGFNRAREETQEVMAGLADALELRDPYTHRHSLRVSQYVQTILSQLPHVPVETAQGIATAARVHDLGKVGIPDAALMKPGRLTPEERELIEGHAAIGAGLVQRLWVYRPWAQVIRHHHERWDGSGYPDRLAGENIPLGARIIAVADAFDAMTSDRVYRPALDRATALCELEAMSGVQFDPQIVDALQRGLADAEVDATMRERAARDLERREGEQGTRLAANPPVATPTS